MSNQIENKVVQMEFENSKFDSRIKESKKSLEDFDKTLEKSFNPESFANMEKALESISKRFSTFGIAGMTVIQNLTTNAMNAVSNFENQVEQTIKVGGLNRSKNIEQAKFQIEGLGYTWGSMFGAINYAVSGTAYSLDAAALAASNLAASGVKIDDVVDTITDVNLAAENGSKNLSSMGQALGAISGVAAMTNSDFSSIASIFSTVAGQGKLMTMQLRQLETRGMNAAAKIAEVLGTTEQNVREMVTRGEIDFNTFSKTMYEAYYTHAKDANRTMTGILANIKSAWAKIGANYYTPLIENDGILVKMLGNYKKKIDEFKVATLPVVDLFVELSEVGIEFADTVVNKIDFKKLGDTLNSVFGEGMLSVNAYNKTMEKLGPTAKTTFEKYLLESFRASNKSADELIKKYGSLTNAVKAGVVPFSVFKDALKKVWDSFDKVTAPIEKTTKALEDYKTVVNEVINGKWGHMETRWKALTEAGYNWAVVQNMVNEQLGSSVRYNEDLSEAEMKNAGYTEEQISVFKDFQKQLKDSNMTMEEYLQTLEQPMTGKEMLVESLKNIIDTLKILASSVSTAWRSIFNNNTTNTLYYIIESIHNFTSAMKEAADGAKNQWTRSFKGLFAAFDLIFYVIQNIASFGFKVFKAVLEGLNISVLDFTASIGDVIVAIDEWVRSNKPLEKVISVIADVITGIITVVSSLIKAVKNSGMMKFLTPIGDFFESLFKLLKMGFESVEGPFDTFINYLHSLDTVSFDDIITGFKNLGKGIKDGLSVGINSLGLATNSLFDFVVDTPKKLKGFDLVSGIGEFFRNIIEETQKVIETLDLEPIISGLFIVLNIKLIKGINGLGRTISDSIGGMFSAIGEGVESFLLTAGSALLQYGKAEKWRSIGETIKAITGMLLALAGAVIILGMLPEATLNQGLKAIGIIAGIIAGLMGAATLMSKLSGGLAGGFLGIDIGINGVAETILAIAAAILTITTAIALIDKVVNNSKDINFTLGIVTAIITSIIAVMAAADKLGKSNPTGAIVQLQGVIGFAAAIYILVMAVDKMAAVIEKRGFAVVGALTVITVLITEMIAVMAVAALAGKPALSGTLALIPVSLFFVAMTGVITVLGIIPDSIMRKGILRVGELTLFLIGIVGMLGIASAMSGGVISAGGTLAGIAFIILSMSVSIMLLSMLKPDKALRGMGAMAAVIVGVGAIIKEVSKMDNGVKNAKGTMIGISILIAVIAGSLVALSMIDAEKLMMPLISMGIMVTILMGLLKQVAKLSQTRVESSNIKGILAALAAVIAVIAASLVALSIVDNPQATLAAALAISMVLLALAGVFKIITDSKRYTKDSGPFKNMMKQLTLLAGIMVLVAGALFALTAMGQTPEQLIGAAAAISIVLLTLTGIFAIISKIGYTKIDIKSVALTFAALALVTGLVALILGLMANKIDDTSKAIESAEALSIMLISFTVVFAALALLSKIGVKLSAVAEVAAAFDVVVLIITALFAILGAIDELTKGGASALIDKGIAILDKITKGLGTAISNLIDGFLGPVREFAEALAKMPKKAVDGIHYVAELLLAITAASIVGAITKLFGLDEGIFEKFGDHLIKLGTGLFKYAEIVRKMSDEDYKAIAKTAEPLGILVGVMKSLPSTGGFIQWLTGEKDLGGFATNISALADGLNKYVKTIRSQNDTDYDNIKKSAEALQALVEVAQALPVSGPVHDFLFGKKDLTDFADGLPNVSNGIVKYYEGDSDADLAGVKDIPNDAYTGIEASIKAIKLLVKIAGELPDDWDAFTGIEDFSEGIVHLSDGLFKFYVGNTVDGVRLYGVRSLGNGEQVWSAIDAAATALESLAKIATTLQTQADPLQKLGSDTGIATLGAFATFGKELPHVSDGLYNFVNGVGKLKGAKELNDDDYDVIDNATAALESMVGLAKTLTENGSSEALAALGDGTSMSTAITNLVSFSEQLGKGVSAFYNNLKTYSVDSIGNVSAKTFDFTLLKTAVTAATDLGAAFKSLGTEMNYADITDDFKTAAGNAASGVVKFYKTMMASGYAEFSRMDTYLHTVSDVVTTLGEITGTEYFGWTTFAEAMAAMPVSLIQDFIDKWDEGMGDEKTAVQAIKDFFSSIKDEMDAGIKDISSVKYGDKLYNVFDKKNAQWKVLYSTFYETGKYVGEGFSKGLISEVNIVRAGANAALLGIAALKSLRHETEVKSPSRKARRIGRFTGEGFQLGLADSVKGVIDVISKSATKVTGSTLTYFQATRDKITSIAEAGIMDITPTIRPVMDTSGVFDGLNTIDNMMQSRSLMAARARITENVVAAYDESKVSNRDVVNAVAELKNSMGSIRPNNTYTIGNLTYDESSSVAQAIETLFHASIVEGRA